MASTAGGHFNTSANRLVLRSPPLPFSYSTPPQEWNLRPHFNPLGRSPGHRLQCLVAELATNENRDVIIILDIKFFADSIHPNARVQVCFGELGVMTTAQAAASARDGTTYVWGSLPLQSISPSTAIMLRVVSGSAVLDALLIGRIDVTLPGVHGPLAPDVASSSSSPERISASRRHRRLEHNRRHHHSSDSPFQQVQLRLEGDFEAMKDGWSVEEVEAGRRIVRLRRLQEGEYVSLQLSPESATMAKANKAKPSMLVSCIRTLYEGHDYVITSFDILKMAEFILDVKMTTEMKNRARRNMSSVPSKTLYKPKAGVDMNSYGVDETFRRVMGFGAPKPRSITKSIKLYDWNAAEKCLDKILAHFVVVHRNDGVVGFEQQVDAARRLSSETVEVADTIPSPLKNESSPAAFASHLPIDEPLEASNHISFGLLSPTVGREEVQGGGSSVGLLFSPSLLRTSQPFPSPELRHSQSNEGVSASSSHNVEGWPRGEPESPSTYSNSTLNYIQSHLEPSSTELLASDMVSDLVVQNGHPLTYDSSLQYQEDFYQPAHFYDTLFADMETSVPPFDAFDIPLLPSNAPSGSQIIATLQGNSPTFHFPSGLDHSLGSSSSPESTRFSNERYLYSDVLNGVSFTL